MTVPVNVRKHVRRRTTFRKPSLNPIEGHTDTRRLFSDWTARKTPWEDMPKIDIRRFLPEEQRALKALPRVVMADNVGVFDSFFEGTKQMEWIVKRGGKTYYVNTEGFDYARYGFEIIGFRGR